MSRTPSTTARRFLTKKRILIVNCFFDESRQSVRRRTKIPQPLAPVYLAGAFKPELCDLRLYDEVDSGSLTDEHLLGWPDMLVLTGLTNSFDRMLHLTAYARTKNPKVLVVAGGAPIRALPGRAARFFDYCCVGDIEQLQDVIRDAFGQEFVAEEMLPRFDLAYWLRHFNYAETTRYCNFRCSFCALTGEGRSYQKYDLDYIRKQMLGWPKPRVVIFADNNFYGSDRNHFLARLDLIKEMRQAGRLDQWSALVTGDFFLRDENLKLIREAGCRLLFSGVESFDTEWLKSVDKPQNTHSPQVEVIRRCLDAGIIFCYGLILDVTTRSLMELRRELEFIASTPEITLPSFLTLPIPLLGTPYFSDCASQRRILPNTKLRDMDGSTLVLKTLDPTEEVVRFVRDMLSLRGYRRRVLAHTVRFLRRYRSKLNKTQMAAELTNAALLCAYALATSPTSFSVSSARSRRRTHLSTTEILDSVYTPAFRVASRFESYFKPTMVTDGDGALTEEMADCFEPKTTVALKGRLPA
ncbi:MAG TPA: radical SAM protein [Pyrinomonadaceae bacterium]|jgi:hypothetical protein